MVRQVGVEPTMFLMSRFYRPLPSPTGYTDAYKRWARALTTVVSARGRFSSSNSSVELTRYFGAADQIWTGTIFLSEDFKSSVSADSTTAAFITINSTLLFPPVIVFLWYCSEGDQPFPGVCCIRSLLRTGSRPMVEWIGYGRLHSYRFNC